ncbi:AarF/ABC1/UbiB kinase family protein [bacterium]|nr:AarF/ABC1/UbiB kinase family protein [bacterium]
MKWIRTGLQLGQAVKNVQRLRQILGVLAKHGFGDLIDRMDLGKYVPTKLIQLTHPEPDLSTPVRLRLVMEELGPTFVKLGQLLSTRQDLLPESFIDEFVKLQDNVPPIPFAAVKTAIETELKGKLEDLYADFNPAPIGAASIAQVHEATLKTGEKVVVKVQRPGIDKTIDTDISLLAFLAGLLEKYVPETQIISPKIIIDEFFRTLTFELDFLVEANNIVQIQKNMESIPEIVIPKVYKQVSSRRVLTLEKIEGVRVNDLKAIEAAGIDRRKIVEIGARGFFKSVMIDGLFHGDLHGGNLFVMSGNRLGIIDFGIVGRLSEKSRGQLTSMLMSLLSNDFDNLCYQYAELGSSGPGIDFEGFQREVRNTLAPYMGLTLEDVNTGKVLIAATKIAAKYNIKVPGDWMLVFKAIVTVEGMGRTLDPNFDLMSVGRDLVKDLIQNQYSWPKISRDLIWVAKDMAELLQMLPRQIRWMFKKFNSNDFAVEIRSPDLQDLRKQVDSTGRRIGNSVLIAGLFVAASLAINQTTDRKIWDLPVLSVIYVTIGFLLLLRLFFSRKY